MVMMGLAPRVTPTFAERSLVRDLNGRRSGQSPNEQLQDGESLFVAARRTSGAFEDLTGRVARRFEGAAHPPPRGVLKSYERALEKVRTDYRGDWTQLKDTLRSSISFDSLPKLYAALGYLASLQSPRLIQVIDWFEKPLPYGYAHVKARLRYPSGVRAELQLTLHPYAEAHALQSTLYQRLRPLTEPLGGHAEEACELREGIRRIMLLARRAVLSGAPFDARLASGLVRTALSGARLVHHEDLDLG